MIPSTSAIALAEIAEALNAVAHPVDPRRWTIYVPTIDDNDWNDFLEHHDFDEWKRGSALNSDFPDLRRGLEDR